MYLGAPDNDAFLLPVDHAEVEILVLDLLGWMQAPVALYVGHGACQSDVVLLKIFTVVFNAFHVIGLQRPVHFVGCQGGCCQGVHSHAVHQEAAA